MWTKAILLVTTLCCVAIGPQSLALECGDVDGSGVITVMDPVRILDHIAMSGQPIEASRADCDGYAGITIGDAQTILRYLFKDIDERDCSAAATYSFAPANNDTVFLPYMLNVGDAIDSVMLPVITSFEASTEAFYVPLLGDTAAWGGYFYPKRLQQLNGSILSMYEGAWVMFFNEFDPYHDDMTGRHVYFTLVMYRFKAGVGSIMCETTELSSLLRPSVEKGTGDLFVPVIAQYEVQAPVLSVTVSPTTLDFTAMAGGWAYSSQTISFASDQGAVSFSLDALDDWIVIEDYQAEGYSTPCTVTVRAYAGLTPTGDYTGSIVITNPVPEDAAFNTTTINVNFDVADPLAFAPGDLNCDGIISISDLSVLIDHLFISQAPIEPCP